MLTRHLSVRSLNLSQNQVKEAGGILLASAWAKQNSQNGRHLQKLDISYN
jgi:hypothetical protein